MGIEGVLAVGPEVCCACARMSEGFSFPVLVGVTHPLLSLYQGRVTEGSWGCGLEHLHPPATFLSWNLKLLSLSWQGYWSWWLRCSCLMEFRAWWLWATKPGCSRKQLSHQLGVHPSWVGLLSWKGKCVSLNLQEGGFLKYRTSGACWSQTLNCYGNDRIWTWLPPSGVKKKLPAEGAAALLPSLSKLVNCSSLITGNSLNVSKESIWWECA